MLICLPFDHLEFNLIDFYGWQSSLNKGMPQTAKYGCRIQEHQMQNISQIFIASKQSQLPAKAQQASKRKQEQQSQPYCLCFLENNENIKMVNGTDGKSRLPQKGFELLQNCLQQCSALICVTGFARVCTDHSWRIRD